VAGQNKTVHFRLIQVHSWDWNLRTSVWQVLERYVCRWSIIVSLRVCMWLKAWKRLQSISFEVCICFNVYCKRYCIHAWLLYTVKSVERREQEYSFHMVLIVATCSEWDYRPNHQVLTITLFVAWLHILWPHWWCCCGIASSCSTSQSMCTGLRTNVFRAVWIKGSPLWEVCGWHLCSLVT